MSLFIAKNFWRLCFGNYKDRFFKSFTEYRKYIKKELNIFF